MDRDTVDFYAGYNEKVNGAMNSLIGKLTEGEWNREFRGYFKSVKSLCNHIYVCDVNWLKRFSSLRHFKYSREDIMKNPCDFTHMHLSDVGDYIGKRTYLDGLIREFSLEVRTGDLSEDLIYTDSHGIEYTRNFGLLVLHMFNHGTHHRGVISHYLEELGYENDFNNIYSYL